MAHGRCGRALERLLGGLRRSVWGLGMVLGVLPECVSLHANAPTGSSIIEKKNGVMLAPKMAAKSGKYRIMYGSKRQAFPDWFFDGFCVEDKQPRRPQSLYLSLGIRV